MMFLTRIPKTGSRLVEDWNAAKSVAVEPSPNELYRTQVKDEHAATTHNREINHPPNLASLPFEQKSRSGRDHAFHGSAHVPHYGQE